MGLNAREKCKQCRAVGEKLFLKGDRCFSSKCAMTRRPFVPGVHGPTKMNTKLSGYGTQLREKQKAKRYYGLMERQFRNYFEAAKKKTGDTGVHLVQAIEMRLDNVVFRMGFVPSRRQGRQFVSHGFFTVNGENVNIPSYQVRPGDIIGIAESKEAKKALQGLGERLAKVTSPAWLTLNKEELTGKVLSKPEGADLKQLFDTKLIIELYSR